ncbi:Methyltransferase type 11 [Nitrobacter hamburgensis X14]|uniref:Methyltransferase type 11 n=1 Tax=Nitrobacter hamburgensis (strain DSM 10229 / NCIMB 13809 / X14) TaxID=323097 RepID=Q1QJ18_NITHX|nr:methyltransferase domain-containing protein [Nitrobacter hamburgensis]ABE63779.1 Methyltransferase type 11 [Nitrobacter hamburgensis X14]
MEDSSERGRLSPLRVLVAIASYGASNDRYLKQLIREYQTMSFAVDIVIISNIEKRVADDIECLVGLPSRNPWSLPFSHKKLFADRADRYDLFIYSEDDILITEKNLLAFLDVTASLQDDEVAGFLRIEKGDDDVINFPDVHAYFHWNTTSVRSRGQYTLASFTNEHAACYVLTRQQLAKAIKSGGFIVEPHEGKYDLLCTAATDPYTQCGLTKLIPVSHLDDFTVHHLSNKYVDSMGIRKVSLLQQIGALLQAAADPQAPPPLLGAETRLWRCMYSKDYYEPASEPAVAMIPDHARSILSIGCGSGCSERRLVERGCRVVAAPLDPVIASYAAAQGIEMVPGDLRAVLAKVESEQFDCVLYQNVLHLAPDPVEMLALFRSVLAPSALVIIQVPNMLCIPVLWRGARDRRRLHRRGGYEATGVHFTSVGRIREWCHRAGLTLDKVVPILHRRAEPIRPVMRGFVGVSMAPELVVVARAALPTSAPADKTIESVRRKRAALADDRN